MNRQVHVIPQDEVEEVEFSESRYITEASLLSQVVIGSGPVLSVVKNIITERPERPRISYPAFHAIPLDIDQKPIGKPYYVFPTDADDRYKTFMEVLENAYYINGMFRNMFGPVIPDTPIIDSFVYVVSTQYGFDVHDMRALTLVMQCLNAHPENVRISAFIVSTDIDFYICPSFTTLK